jgi:hypothetical protein
MLEHLQKKRVLIVLDNLEDLVLSGDIKGRFRPGFEEYEQLLQQIAEKNHRSCLLLTSREKPAKLRPLEGKNSPVRALRLGGLDIDACKQILEEKRVVGNQMEQEQLIDAYGGNPLALKMIAETIIDLFGGEIGPFLDRGMLVFGSLSDLLDEQFARLSSLEQSMLRQLAIAREPMMLDELMAALAPLQPRTQIFEAIDAGYRRSLVERGQRPGSFTLQSMMREYMTTVLQR